jgi:enamine deaminase RidA (YjgF/YER057c/UK114 family)
MNQIHLSPLVDQIQLALGNISNSSDYIFKQYLLLSEAVKTMTWHSDLSHMHNSTSQDRQKNKQRYQEQHTLPSADGNRGMH